MPIIFPDVSSYQTVNWVQLANSGTKLAFMKASEGGWQDPTFNDNWKQSRKAGIKIRGAYHYGRLYNSPTNDAKQFVDIVKSAGGIKPGDFLVLDIEDVNSSGISHAQTVAWVSKWLKEVQTDSGLPISRIVIYTGEWWWGSHTGDSSAFSKYPLWVSSYSSSVEKVGGWSSYAFWQFTDHQHFTGIGSCDGSRFNGTIDQLNSMAGLTTTVIPTPIVPVFQNIKPGQARPELTKLKMSLHFSNYSQNYGTLFLKRIKTWQHNHKKYGPANGVINLAAYSFITK